MSKPPGPVGMALRAAGYKPCPRWWVTEEQLELIEYMRRQNSEEISRIRREVGRKAEIEKAWREKEGGR